MKRTKLMVLVSMIVVAMMLVMACSPQATSESPSAAASEQPAEQPAEEATEEPAEEPAETDDEIVIGFAQATMASPFYVSQVEAAKEAAANAGVGFEEVDADEDVTQQNTQILDLIQKGIDVLILNAVDPDGVAPALEACAENNIPVVTVDRFVNAEVACVVGRDNTLLGEMVGEAVVEALGGSGNIEGVKILEVMGSAGDRVQEARSGGFHNVLDAEGVEFVQTDYCNYVRSLAATATQTAIQAHDDIALIYGHNDDMALGALQVCIDNGLDVKASGVDGLMEAVDAIAAGTYVATAANDPLSMGEMAFDIALKLANGETVDATADPGTFLIDATNAAEYQNAELAFAHAE